MFVVNVLKLKGRIIERGYNCSTFAQEIGISKKTLYNYMTDPEKIPYKIIEKMVSVLFDSPDDAMQVFFAQKLS